MVPVVQLVRASDCGSECRGFESHRAPPRRGFHLSFFYFLQRSYSLNKQSIYIRYMTQMKLISLDEALDTHFGRRGTPRREQHEAEVAEAKRKQELNIDSTRRTL